MLKRVLAAVFAALLIFAVGCEDNVVYDDLSNFESIPPVVESVPKLSVNPLTGVDELDNSTIATQRPVAIMVNNVNVAQSRQTGLSHADIIYETEVEGGITRLMAVYQDISKLDKIKKAGMDIALSMPIGNYTTTKYVDLIEELIKKYDIK